MKRRRASAWRANGQSSLVLIPSEIAHDSEFKSLGGTGTSSGLFRVRSFGFAKEGPDADGEDVDAPCARLREIEERRDVDARDCAAGRSGVVDGSVDASPVRGRRHRLAAGRRFD